MTGHGLGQLPSLLTSAQPSGEQGLRTGSCFDQLQANISLKWRKIKRYENQLHQAGPVDQWVLETGSLGSNPALLLPQLCEPDETLALSEPRFPHP